MQFYSYVEVELSPCDHLKYDIHIANNTCVSWMLEIFIYIFKHHQHGVNTEAKLSNGRVIVCSASHLPLGSYHELFFWIWYRSVLYSRQNCKKCRPQFLKKIIGYHDVVTYCKCTAHIMKAKCCYTFIDVEFFNSTLLQIELMFETNWKRCRY